ncbi:hypothetical protein DFH11DRAFT_1609575 [Phellopilus nigrolimitatus]|nr:hypothetical protein DFH11DRAFT_1609575 [Phellopilus nigrolimitatus]
MLPPPTPLHRPSHSSKAPLFVESHESSTRTNQEILRSGPRVRLAVPIRRQASNDTVHFKRRHAEPVALPRASLHPSPRARRATFSLPVDFPVNNHSDDEDEDDDDDEDDEVSTDEDDDKGEGEPPTYVAVPARSPLRRSFGIFCTSKGRGAFSGSVQHRRPRNESARFLSSPKDATNV